MVHLNGHARLTALTQVRSLRLWAPGGCVASEEEATKQIYLHLVHQIEMEETTSISQKPREALP